jgi:hypothetical protein
MRDERMVHRRVRFIQKLLSRKDLSFFLFLLFFFSSTS